MAAANKFEDFILQLGKGVHHLESATDQLDVYLSNAVPSVSADTIKSELLEITNEFGYTAPEDIDNDYTETTGTGTLTGVDVVITASGGSFGPFQYVVLDNDTPATPLDPLIVWWDFGSALTVNDAESFTVDFGASVATIGP